jgi:sterol desaturase/sphingolipid hydroxylase (fatty acid hydroxylase superfamily)
MPLIGAGEPTLLRLSRSGRHGGLDSPPLAIMPAPLATLALCSLAAYGAHVFMHKVPLLWKVHRVHHLDTHLDISTTLRSHPLEMAVKL